MDDDLIRERLEKYDRWKKEGRIPNSSTVVPVMRSVPSKQWVMPSEQVAALLGSVRIIALGHCDCRVTNRNCDNPTETCLFLDQTAEAMVRDGEARFVSLEEALAVAAMADEYGLVHLTINNPEQHPYVLCSCCSCCCHDFRFIKTFGRSDLITRSDYVAVTDENECIHCGVCVERCPFDARRMEDEEMVYDPGQCFGCGVCVSACPTEALTMQRK